MASVTALQTRTRHLTNRKTVSIVKDAKYTTNSIQYHTFGSACFTTTPDTVIVEDSMITDLLLDYADAGIQLSGNYKDVWYTLMADLQDQYGIDIVPFSHYRGVQIGRCGKKYQIIVGDQSFNLLCPDLQQFASSWSH